MSDEKPNPKYLQPSRYAKADKRLCREIIECALNKTIPERLLELCAGDPEFEADVLLGLLPYCYPKLGSIDVKAHVESDVGEGVNELVDWLKRIDKIE